MSLNLQMSHVLPSIIAYSQVILHWNKSYCNESSLYSQKLFVFYQRRWLYKENAWPEVLGRPVFLDINIF